MSFATSDMYMRSFQDAVMRTIELGGPDILEDKHLFCNIIEDLVPYHERDCKFLKKTFDSKLGRMLKSAIEFEEQRNQYYRDILIYLTEEVGLSEKKVLQFIVFFPFLKNDSYVGIHQNKDNRNSQKTGTANSFNDNDLSPVNIKDRIEKYIEEGDVSSAVAVFERSEKQMVSSEAYSNICFMIGEALGESDPEKAVFFLEKAAKKGDGRALFMLGDMYENGDGVVADLSKAVLYYKSAANNGNRDAQHNLACLYYSGNGVNRDYKNAFEYFSKAAQLEKAESMKSLGVMYELGQYVSRNYEKALECYKIARKYGDLDADEYCRMIEKKIRNVRPEKQIIFRVMNKDAETKEMNFNIGEEIRGRSFSEHLSIEPVLKLLYNKNIGQVGIKNLSFFEWEIVKKNKLSQPCLPNKVVLIEEGDMIRIIHRVVQLNVLSIISGKGEIT